MFGVHFIGNFNLHRLLSDYGFNGYPLRKDFPPTGYLEAFYIEKVKVIQKHKLGLMQEMRESYFTATWGSAVAGDGDDAGANENDTDDNGIADIVNSKDSLNQVNFNKYNTGVVIPREVTRKPNYSQSNCVHFNKKKLQSC